MIKDRVLESLAKVDKDITYRIYSALPRSGRNKSILKALEWSCHGIPWLAATLALIYLFPERKGLTQLLIGLVLDVVYVAILKAYSRRRRPEFCAQDDQFLVVSVDKHSFPSGHASRAIYFALFTSSSVFGFLVWVWALAVVGSRVLLGRHHVGDVVAGALLGFLEYAFQFGIGAPIGEGIAWLFASIIGVQFMSSNDQSDGEISIAD